MLSRNTAQYDEELSVRHQSTLWAHFVNIFFAFWLIVAPYAFHYTSKTMTYSDQITGLVILIFSSLALSRRMLFAPWVVCFAGFG